MSDIKTVRKGRLVVIRKEGHSLTWNSVKTSMPDFLILQAIANESLFTVLTHPRMIVFKKLSMNHEFLAVDLMSQEGHILENVAVELLVSAI